MVVAIVILSVVQYMIGNKRVLLPAAESAALWDKPNRLESLRKRLASHLVGILQSIYLDSMALAWFNTR